MASGVTLEDGVYVVGFLANDETFHQVCSAVGLYPHFRMIFFLIVSIVSIVFIALIVSFLSVCPFA